MVDYLDALKKPFSDATKLVLSMVIGILPIVNFMFSGYLLNVAENAMRRRKELPKWEGLGTLFVHGLLQAVISFVYMIPVLIALVLALFSGALALPLSTQALGLGMYGIIQAMIGMGIMFFLALLVLGAVFTYLAIAATLRYADTREFGEAFNFKEVIKKAFNTGFFGSWLVTTVIAFFVSFLLSLIPYVGSIIAVGVVGIFYMTAMGQAYSEI